MTTHYDYDLFVIGAGSGGLAASKNAAKLGKKVAICEYGLVGGTCVIRGCVPKKIMSYAGQISDTFSDAEGYGFTAPNKAINFAAFAAKRNAEIARLNQLHIRFLKESGVELIQGYGKLVNNRTISVNGKEFTAETIILATGSTPTKLPIEGAEHTLISDDLWDLTTLPKTMTVIGGGYIAVEFASIFQALGTQVHIVIRRDLILRGFDADIRTKLQEEMHKRGITFHTNVNPKSFTKNADGSVTTHLDNGENITTEITLMATGRKPHTDTLGVEFTNIKRDKSGAVKVNEHLQTNEHNVYAVGDMIDRVNLTPVAIKHGRMVTNNLYLGTNTVVDDTSPTAVFTNPPVGTVGLTEKEAADTFGQDDIHVYTSDFKPMAHQLSGRDERSFMKMIVQKSTDKVVGLHMMGRDAAEIIQGFAVAVRAGLTKKDFDATVAIHPSSAEEFVLMR